MQIQLYLTLLIAIFVLIILYKQLKTDKKIAVLQKLLKSSKDIDIPAMPASKRESETKKQDSEKVIEEVNSKYTLELNQETLLELENELKQNENNCLETAESNTMDENSSKHYYVVNEIQIDTTTNNILEKKEISFKEGILYNRKVNARLHYENLKNWIISNNPKKHYTYNLTKAELKIELLFVNYLGDDNYQKILLIDSNFQEIKENLKIESLFLSKENKTNDKVSYSTNTNVSTGNRFFDGPHKD